MKHMGGQALHILKYALYKNVGYAPGYALGYAPMICAEDGGMRQLGMRHSQKSTALPRPVFVVVGYAPGMR